MISTDLSNKQLEDLKEVLRDGARMIQQNKARLDALDVILARGVAASDAGQAKSAEEVCDRLEKQYSAKLLAE